MVIQAREGSSSRGWLTLFGRFVCASETAGEDFAEFAEKEAAARKSGCGSDMIHRKLGRCALYLALIGALCFYVGRLLPGDWFHSDRFPFRCFPFERGGRVYEKLGIRRWKDKVPDMSRYIPHTFRKKIGVMRSPEHVEGLIRETCVAELVHVVLILLSPVFLVLLPRGWNWICMLLYDLFGNLPFILIQRYNRPRLVILLERQREVQAMQAAKRAARALS